MEIKIGDLMLYDTKTFVIPKRNLIEITFGENREILHMEIEFIKDNKDKKRKLEAIEIDKNTVRYVLYNYENSSGSVLFSESPAGDLLGKELFLAMNISGAYKNSVKIMTISFYLGKEISNG